MEVLREYGLYESNKVRKATSRKLLTFQNFFNPYGNVCKKIHPLEVNNSVSNNELHSLLPRDIF
jgi:hypothetical protein